MYKPKIKKYLERAGDYLYNKYLAAREELIAGGGILPIEREKGLIRLYQNAQTKELRKLFLDRIFKYHNCLIVTFATRLYYRMTHHRSHIYEDALRNYTPEDALSSAYESYIRCLDSFNCDYPYSFSTYFYRAIYRNFFRYTTEVKFRITNNYNIQQMRIKANCELSKNPNQSIADILNDTQLRYMWEFEIIRNPKNIDDYDIAAPEPSETVALDAQEIRDHIHKLPKRYIDILNMRADGKTLKEIGETLNITRERVRQLLINISHKISRLIHSSRTTSEAQKLISPPIKAPPKLIVSDADIRLFTYDELRKAIAKHGGIRTLKDYQRWYEDLHTETCRAPADPEKAYHSQWQGWMVLASRKPQKPAPWNSSLPSKLRRKKSPPSGT